MQGFWRGLTLSLLLAGVFPAGSALADEVSSEPSSVPAAEAPAGLPEPEAPPPSSSLAPPPLASAAGPTPVEDWRQRRHWRYGSWGLFPLSRGMEDAGIPPAVRPFLYVFTVPFDLAQLPFAAIGGLFGS